MTVNLNALPDGYMLCEWCGWAVKTHNDKGEANTRCPKCGLHISPPEAKKSRTRKASAAKTEGAELPIKPTPTSARDKRSHPKIGTRTEPATGKRVMGIDPGARYTAVLIRDGDEVLYSTTLVRDKDQSSHEWARLVVAGIKEILAEQGEMPIGVEGVSDPKGFKHGERASLNPAHIIRAGIVFGAIVAVWTDATVIPPGGNGSQHSSHYPDVLKGRRPKDLPGSSEGAGTRAHEQSAYDIAGKTAKIVYKTEPEKLKIV